MAESDMDISCESDNESTARGNRVKDTSLHMPVVPQEMVSLIPMPPSSAPSVDDSSYNITKSKSSDRTTAHMPLKKRWRHSVELEPKKRKVSLEAYRKRHVSGGESVESALSPSEADSLSMNVRRSIKKEHRLTRDERDHQSGKKLQKMTISDLEKRKIKLKRALKQIESSSSSSHDRKLNGSVDAKTEFDKFMEKQNRWLEKRAREKQREAKLEKFTSSIDVTHSHSDVKLRGPVHAFDKTAAISKLHSLKQKIDLLKSNGSRNHDRNRLDSHVHPPSNDKDNKMKKVKRVAVVRPRSQSELTSTLQCLQKANEEVQRQLELLKTPGKDNSCTGTKSINAHSRKK